MTKLYNWFLWIIGFREDESDDDTISDMLWRQKQRMGVWWWLMSIGTIVFTVAILGFQIWLLLHTIYLKAKGLLLKLSSPRSTARRARRKIK